MFRFVAGLAVGMVMGAALEKRRQRRVTPSPSVRLGQELARIVLEFKQGLQEGLREHLKKQGPAPAQP